MTPHAASPDAAGGSAEPLVTIVIPTWNRRALLAEAVESSLAQSWRRVDVLIVDDGSNDGTEDFARRSIDERWGTRVRYVRQANRGAAAARNRGLALAEGTYIQFLDSDDLLYRDKIAAQARALEEPRHRAAAACLCYGAMGRSPAAPSLQRIGYATAEPQALLRRLAGRGTHFLQTAAPLWRRSFLEARAGWREDIVLGDDLEYHVRLLAEASALAFVDDTLFFVRAHPGARLSAGMSAASLASLVRARRAVHATLHRCGLWDRGTQHAFLEAMRTVYANALALGERASIEDLEAWLWTLSGSPRRRWGFRAMLLLRRTLGRQILLAGHRLLSRAAGAINPREPTCT